jgi:hypothetical protein
LGYPKWGNSLAVRLPAELARQMGARKRNTHIVEISGDGRLVLAAEGHTIGRAGARGLRQFLKCQKAAAPVVGDVRGARNLWYMPIPVHLCRSSSG